MNNTPLQLIVGLGNPGLEYEKTRHNAGFWFVEQLAKKFEISLRAENKFLGLTGQFNSSEHSCRLLLPTTFMNRSGHAIQALANFYKIPAAAILIAHDELDLEVGTARLKQGGGHGGHNGLRDTIDQLGTKDFWRLRLGIAHPGHKDKVVDYVLNRPSKADQQLIMDSIDNALSVLPEILTGDMQKAMRQLHIDTKHA